MQFELKEYQAFCEEPRIADMFEAFKERKQLEFKEKLEQIEEDLMVLRLSRIKSPSLPNLPHFRSTFSTLLSLCRNPHPSASSQQPPSLDPSTMELPMPQHNLSSIHHTSIVPRIPVLPHRPSASPWISSPSNTAGSYISSLSGRLLFLFRLSVMATKSCHPSFFSSLFHRLFHPPCRLSFL
ncbi:hypothetical protein SLEP1_g53257 [Rubroshorea leprosula]|uniref:Uncharacterized protein n=1 Tax=Rubroshorea leprosula TaxID=152421 RepID=A0AAV5M9R1_9ROSI|nr:hypothetical protein SLEP1_g53257 [Rubroshorea leprosula]